MKDEWEARFESTVKGNIDAFFLDLAAGTDQKELSKNVRETRDAQEVDHELNAFLENLEPGPTGGRATGHTRLRSERPALDERDRRPDFGLEKTESRKKNSLRAWFKAQITSGISATELIAHAEQGGSPATAQALRELAHEMCSE